MTYRFILTFILSFAIATTGVAQGLPPEQTKIEVLRTTPHQKPGGGKWRLAYLGSSDYDEYAHVLRAIAIGLHQLGWISVPDIPKDLDARETWRFLARNVQSDTLKFVEDACIPSATPDVSQRPMIRETVGRRLQYRGDIDLIIAMGTLAGKDMAMLGAPVPTVVVSASDPIGARIVVSAEDSGLDNLHARVQPDRYKRQIELFHEIVPFRVLGLVYEGSAEGRTYAAINDIEQLASKIGYKIKPCFATSHTSSPADIEAGVLACYRKLAMEVDAVYVTVHRGVTAKNIGEIARVLREAKVASFSMLGQEEVQAGLLMSMAQADYAQVGYYHAETIARIFNGARPRELKQIWVALPKIVFNLKTARQIGFDPPVDVLLAADEIFEPK